MRYDGKILAAAREAKAKIRSANELEEVSRLREIYSEIPRIADINYDLAQTSSELAMLFFEKDAVERLKRLEKKNLALQEERSRLLKSKGYPSDYLESIYECKRCKDTGMDGNAICDCMKLLYNKELTKELSPLLKTGDECFENFRLDYYDDDQESRVSPRKVMTGIFNACVNYAEHYSSDSRNLLMTGAPGLGKTYLSACIAKKIAAKGYSVCYETAIEAFDAFALRRFNRDEDYGAEADTKVSRMLSCDLLILDDLGTEFQNSVNTGFLYTIVNDRLIHRKQTIISTNLSLSELSARYGVQIASRLEGEYMPLLFIGSDIRKRKREG